MKSVALPDFATFKTRDVIRQIIEAVPPQSGGIGLADMRHRLKLLDKLDAADETLWLEDAEHEALVRLLHGFPFGVVHPELARIADAIENAS